MSIVGIPTENYNCLKWLKTQTTDYDTFQVKAVAGERILNYDIIYNFTCDITLNDVLYKTHEFNEDTFPLPLVCVYYMIVKPYKANGTFTAIKINDETVRKSLVDTEFCSPIHRVIDGHLRPTKAIYVTRNTFLNCLDQLG